MSANKKDGPMSVAVIGGGVTGMAAAWHLAVNTVHTVQLFEAQDRLGGHACTVKVPGNIDVDIGFMVFNHSNYPNMVEWFKALYSNHHQVQEEDSDMSLSVSLDEGKTVEWSSDCLLAQKSQVFSPAFYQFVWDMTRFNAQAADILQLPIDDPRRYVTTGQYLRDHSYSQPFCTYYLLPMMAALWSASIEDVLQFPAAQLVGFLCNHKMLQIFDRPQWKTVANRSHQYTAAVRSILGEAVHLSTPIVALESTQNGKTLYKLYTSQPNGERTPIEGSFDNVIFACDPPTASKILKEGGFSGNLPELLKKIHYESNVIYVHSDPSLMPRRKAAWASWNCLGKSDRMAEHFGKSRPGEAFEGGESGFGNTTQATKDLEGTEGRMKAVYITYYLNRLQNLKTEQDFFVSLNPHHTPDPSLTHHRVTMAHPQFTPQTLKARKEIAEDYQGKKGLWFCGAWDGYGFHEDGCRAGFQTATKLSGVPLPWAEKVQQMVLSPPDLSKSKAKTGGSIGSLWNSIYRAFSYDVPVAVCKRFICYFLQQAVQKGTLRLKFNDGSVTSFGDGSPCGRGDHNPVTLRILDDWFFVKTALEYDLGLARSYMAGHFVVEKLASVKDYHPVMRPAGAREETTVVLGDPVGLTRLFLLFIGNRDFPAGAHDPRKAGKGHWYDGALTNASGLIIAKFGSLLNYLRYRLTMNNSERGGSLKNIHAHYDLSNDLFRTFLDKETLMYSSAVYDCIEAPSPLEGLVFRGTLEEAQWRKLDTLLERAQIQPGQTMLDIGFGWGGLSLHAARKYGCFVTGITLSVEQKALAEERVRDMGLGSLISFEVVDYRTFARRKDNQGKFDRVLSCEMIEAVGHEHLGGFPWAFDFLWSFLLLTEHLFCYTGEFFWAVEQVLAPDGILVMEAITTPEQRYETYRRSTDFINTIIFPGSCCPSLHALIDAAYHESCLTLEHIDNIGLHYAQTLAEWRRRFNANEDVVRKLSFDDVFLRCWNYYLTYCEAGFFSQTENCLILVFSRPGCSSLVPLCETRSVIQANPLTAAETSRWLEDR